MIDLLYDRRGPTLEMRRLLDQILSKASVLGSLYFLYLESILYMEHEPMPHKICLDLFELKWQRIEDPKSVLTDVNTIHTVHSLLMRYSIKGGLKGKNFFFVSIFILFLQRRMWIPSALWDKVLFLSQGFVFLGFFVHAFCKPVPSVPMEPLDTSRPYILKYSSLFS